MEYAATSLSLTAVVGACRDVYARLVTYLLENHAPDPDEEPRHFYKYTVDPTDRRIVGLDPHPSLPVDMLQTLQAEQWASTEMWLWFDGQRDVVRIYVRPVGEQVQVELWFTTRVYEILYEFDSSRNRMNFDAKADLLRLFLGSAKAIGAGGLAYRMSDEAMVLGPPDEQMLRDLIEVGDRWIGKSYKPYVALSALRVDCVVPEKFELQLEYPQDKFRQNGYYVSDRLWPLDAYQLPSDEDSEDEEDEESSL